MPLVSVAEAAQLVGVAQTQMFRFLKKGRIKGAYKLCGEGVRTIWVIPKAAVLEFKAIPRPNGRRPATPVLCTCDRRGEPDALKHRCRCRLHRNAYHRKYYAENLKST